jgi:hypothetical protein
VDGFDLRDNMACSALLKRKFTMHTRFIVAIICVGLGLAPSAAAGNLPDTPDSRRAAAARYIDIADFDTLVQNIIGAAALKLPENRRSDFKDRMKWKVRVKEIESAAMQSLVTHFTTAELNALVNFAETPRGGAVMQKFGAYMADVMQDIQSEMVRAYRLYKEEQNRESR